MTLPERSTVPLGAARALVALLTLGDVLTTLPQASREGVASVIVLELGGPIVYVLVRIVVLAVGLVGLALAGRWWPALERVALAIVTGALVAAVEWNLAQLAQ